MKTIYFSTSLLASSAFGLSFDVTTTDSLVPSVDDVSYSCTFENEWSQTNHPIDYPSNAHWSPPVLVAHDSGYNMWSKAGMATEGVEVVAETGATSTILNEIADSSSTGDVVTGQATFNSETQMQSFSSIEMTSMSHLLSTITMIAPSPDWFSGFYDFDAINPTTGTWFREFTIETYPFDAGTEEGDTYAIDNPDTSPAEAIFRLDVDTVPSNGVLLNDSGNEVLPVARWICTLEQEDPSEEPDERERPFCFSGNMEVVVQGKGVVPMEALQVCDYVKIGNGEAYEQVYAFGHRVPQKYTEFVQLHTNAGTPLEMTAQHLVFVDGKTYPVRADSIKPGDLLRAKGNNVVVEKIELVRRKGIYNPLTASGTIQVNGIMASNYISFQKENNEYIELQGGVEIMSHHDAAHVAMTPYRFYCTTLAICDINEGNSSGMPFYVLMGIELIEWSKQQHILVQLFMYASFRMLLLLFAPISMTCAVLLIPAYSLSGSLIFQIQRVISNISTIGISFDKGLKMKKGN